MFGPTKGSTSAIAIFKGEAMMQKIEKVEFEYLTKMLDFAVDLNPYAAEGWRVVTAVFVGADRVVFYFERQKKAREKGE
jgi:hypothetical protein